eukprot:2842565-Heterocapsa_arctica.AAC.1
MCESFPKDLIGDLDELDWQAQRQRKEVCIESTSEATDIVQLWERARGEVEDCTGREWAYLVVWVWG